MTDTLKAAPLTFAPPDFADLPEVEDVTASSTPGEVVLSLTTGEDVSAAPAACTVYTTPEGVPVLIEVRGAGSYRLPADKAVLFAWGLHDVERARVAGWVDTALYHLARFCELPEAHRGRLSYALEALTEAAQSWPAAAPMTAPAPLPQKEAPTMPEDLTPYLDGLTPDPAGVESARTYAPFDRPTPLQRLEEFTMSLAFFYKEKAGPGLPEGLSEAVGVFFFAASGFFNILEALRPITPGQEVAAEWRALTYGQMWARSQRKQAGAGLSLEDKEALSRALANPDRLPLLPQWAGQMTAKGQGREAARYAVWAALVYLLEAAPYLEDGETEVLLSELLEAFTLPTMTA